MMIQENTYNRQKAVNYALRYGIQPNSAYPHYQGDDCTNFVSQCLQAGGCRNHFHPTHPWWCVNYKTSMSWAVAHSLYWYIKTCTQENSFGIKAHTVTIQGNDAYSREIANLIEIGDIIQYINFKGRMQHSAIITGFDIINGIKEPLISQHTYNAVNITWRKNHKKVVFHHIIGIN